MKSSTAVLSIHVIHRLLRNAHKVLGLKYLQTSFALLKQCHWILSKSLFYISSRHVLENPPGNNEWISFWISSKQTLSNPQACEQGEWPLRQSCPLKNTFISQKYSKNILIFQKTSEEYVVSQKPRKNIFYSSKILLRICCFSKILLGI